MALTENLSSHGNQIENAREVSVSSDRDKESSSNFIPIMGNFSIQYNFTSASIAVSILSDDGYLGRPYSAEPDWASQVTLPVVFAGAMIGMSMMGRLGDVLGRAKAMRVTLFFTMVGAIIPALCVGSPDAVYGTVCFGRLILGIGVGGIYPLSAVSSAEGQKDPALKSNTVAWAFFWQTVGVVVPYLIAMLMLATIDPQPPQVWVPSFEFRTLFALGALPAGVVFLSSLWAKEAEEFIPDPDQPGVVEMLRRQTPEVRRTLVGTAGSWFVYDLAYYGTAVFTPTILKDIFGQGQTLLATSWQSVIVSLMGVPGCLLAIVLIQRWGGRLLNVIGFIGLAVCFCVMAIMWEQSKPPTLFALFLVLTFLLNFGPNIGTYVLPAICFPAECRSTCHGISATGGKTGACLGAFLFPVVSKGAGIPVVLWINAGVCVFGAIISHFLLKNDWDYLPKDDKLATESFIHGVPAGVSNTSLQAGRSGSSVA